MIRARGSLVFGVAVLLLLVTAGATFAHDGVEYDSDPSVVELGSTADPHGTTWVLNPDASVPGRPGLRAVASGGRAAGLSPNKAVSRWVAKHQPTPGIQDSDQPVLDDLSLPELADLLTYAEDQHKSIVDVAARHGSEPAIEAVTDQLGAAFPGDYLGSLIPKDGRTALHVLFTSTAPAGAIEALKGLDLPIEIEESVGISTTELQEVPTAAGNALAESGTQCTIYFDFRTRAWVVSCDAATGRVDQVKSMAGYLAKTAPVRIDMDRGPVTPSDSKLRGGAKLNGVGGCTSGFVMHTLSGTKRLLTAGHCAVYASIQYVNWPMDGGSQWIARKRHYYGPDDWALYTKGSFTPRPIFYIRTTKKRAVKSQRNTPPPFDSNSCHFGRATGKSCGDFYTAYADVTYTDGTHLTNMSISSHLKAAGGDSGGPVFNGTSAHGIDSGANNNPPSPDDHFIYYEPIWRMLPIKTLKKP